jgi:hypothetical protein
MCITKPPFIILFDTLAEKSDRRKPGGGIIQGDFFQNSCAKAKAVLPWGKERKRSGWK